MEDIKSEYETIRVVQMIEDFVTAHDGNWPSSWEDLDSTETAKRLTLDSLDSTYFRQYTTVDFSATSAILVKHPEMIYTAVMPVTDRYTTYPDAKRDLDRVMEVIVRASQRAQTAPAR